MYLLLFRRLVPAGLPIQLLFVALALSSFPLLHNLTWGQVGILTAVIILGMLVFLEHDQRILLGGQDFLDTKTGRFKVESSFLNSLTFTVTSQALKI